MTDEERIAQLGKPKLGDLVTISVHIRESIEFKVRTQRHVIVAKYYAAVDNILYCAIFKRF